MNITTNHVVEIDYTLTDNDGEIIDRTENNKPMKYIHGKTELMPALEEAISGKKINDKFKVSLSPKQSYGEFDDSLIQSIDKAEFGEDAPNIQLGMRFNMEGAEGNKFIATAIEIKDNEVIVDGNHPFAGETLHFDIEVKTIRDATPEELQNGLESKKSSCCESGSCSK